MLCVHRITEYPLGCEDLCGLDSGNDEGLVAARSQLGMLSLLHLYLLSSPLVLNFDIDTPNNIWSGSLVALLHSHKQASKQVVFNKIGTLIHNIFTNGQIFLTKPPDFVWRRFVKQRLCESKLGFLRRRRQQAWPHNLTYSYFGVTSGSILNKKKVAQLTTRSSQEQSRKLPKHVENRILIIADPYSINVKVDDLY